MTSALVLALLVLIAFQLAMIIRRLNRDALIAGAIKIHLREAKEEHWAQLQAIRAILLAQVEADGRVPDERKKILRDTPEQLGEHGHWRYHMPNNYLELDWQGYEPMPNEHRLAHILEEAGLKRKALG